MLTYYVILYKSTVLFLRLFAGPLCSGAFYVCHFVAAASKDGAEHLLTEEQERLGAQAASAVERMQERDVSIQNMSQNHTKSQFPSDDLDRFPGLSEALFKPARAA